MMEEWLKIIVPLLGFVALWWKLTTSVATKKDISDLRADMNRGDDNLRAEINKLNEKMDAGFTRLDAKIDAGLARLDEKIDANSQAHHTDIMQVINKIDGVVNDLRAEIRERISRKSDSADS